LSIINIPLQNPSNFQLISDELDTRFGFKRHRESVAAFVRSHFPNLVAAWGFAGHTPFEARRITLTLQKYVYRNDPYHPGSSSIAWRRRLLLWTPLIEIVACDKGFMSNRELILLVEDNEDHALLIRRGLCKGPSVESLQVAISGEEALEYLGGTGRYSDRDEFPLPSVVLLDLELPGISGFEVLRWIRKQTELKSVWVVVMTCSESEQNASLASILGANSFIVKPKDLDSLIQMVEASRPYWLGPQAVRKEPQRRFQNLAGPF
jgi:CheY-like chemotaxis protein